MKNSIANGIIVLAVLFVGYHVSDALWVAHKASTFGGGLRQELESIGTGKDYRTLKQMDIDLCVELANIGTGGDPEACSK